ncbi:MAG: hypothetical protein HY292_14100 [Planctomycetes bacterium]|nr:hypothetical protein [Planctomycetota bacterium]
MNDVCHVAATGFDLSRVLVYYDVANDALFLGIDVADERDRRGNIVRFGVPGDVDGDGSPDAPATNRTCIQDPYYEEDGVGPNEFYRILLDTNANGNPSEDVDVLVQYRDNHLSILNPHTMQPIPGATGLIKLGTAGAGGVNTGIPDDDENTNATDIEIRVDHWCRLDPTPFEFTVLGWAAAFSGLPADTTSVFPVQLATDYRRDGATVLRVNAESNWSCVPLGQTVQVSLVAADGGPPSARFALWVWQGAGTGPVELSVRGVSLGFTAGPTPLNPRASPQPIRCVRSPDLPSQLCAGVPETPGPARAPWTITRQAGFHVPIVITLQGLIEDAAASNPLGFSLTNVVTLQVHR